MSNNHGKPETLNTDQGSEFTNQALTGLLKQIGIQISMDRKDAWREGFPHDVL